MNLHRSFEAIFYSDKLIDGLRVSAILTGITGGIYSILVCLNCYGWISPLQFGVVSVVPSTIVAYLRASFITSLNGKFDAKQVAAIISVPTLVLIVLFVLQ
jgi:hypothetical protein